MEVQGTGNAESLRGLAEHTGGRATVDTNTPWTAVPAMLEETGSYYLIGFETTRTDGRFHPLEVRVNRPGVIVRSRTGYFAPSRADATTTRAEAVDDVPVPVDHALSGGLPVATLPLSALATARQVAGEREADVTVITRIDVPAVAVGAPAPTVDVVALAFDTNWRQRAADRRSVEITRPVGTHAEAPAEIVSRLRLRPGRYEIRVAAETEGRTGSVYLDLQVPDFASDALSVSGPMLIPGVRIDGVDVSSPVPTVRRTFNRAESVAVLTHVWQGGRGRPEAVTVFARVADVAGRQLWETDTPLPVEEFAAARSAPHILQLPLATLAPGEHVLTIDVTRNNSTLSRHIRFVVQ